MRKSAASIFRHILVLTLAANLTANILFCNPSAAHPVATPVTIESAMKEWLERPEVAKALAGIEIVDMETGSVLFALNAGKRFVPASALKILIGACAFDSLGPEFRYVTRLGYTGTIENQTLKGNLIVSPAQDPSLTSADLALLVQGLKKKALSSVDGKLIVTVAQGSAQCFSPFWLIEDWGQKWMPVSSNLVVDRNLYRLPPGAGQLQPSSNPDTNPPSTLDSSLLKSGTTHGWAIWNPDSKSVSFYRNPSPRRRKSINLMIANPEDYNLALTASYITKTGVKLKGYALEAGMADAAIPLSAHFSKPLAEVLKTTLRKSDNLYAQQLLRTVGAMKGDSESTLLLEKKGLQFLRNWMSKAGVNASDLFLIDACGLSRKDQITPHALNKVLCYMRARYPRGEFFDLLRQRRRPGLGNFQFKTGAMDGICTITGVITCQSGKQLAFTALVNGHKRLVGKTRRSFGPLAETLMKCPLKSPEQQAQMPRPGK